MHIIRHACSLAVAFSTCLMAGVVLADDVKPVDGVLTLSGKPYKLQHAVAYETKVFGKPGIAVIASDRPISVDAIKTALADKKGDGDVSLRQPHVRIVFENSGKVSSYYATAAGFTASAGGDEITAELKREGDRVTGKAAMPSQGEGNLQRSFDFQFSLGLVGTTAETRPVAAPLAKLGVSGTFKGNGNDARLAFVSARQGEPFADKPSVVLVFTERDHSRDPKPDFKAGFGDYGSALIISCHEDGGIFGCEVAHAAHAKKPFSSLGSIDTSEFQIAGGQVQGTITTSGEVKTFDQTWEVNLKFAAPFAGLAKPPETKNAATNVASRDAKSESGSVKRSTQEPAAKSEAKAAPKLNVKELAILRGVENVEYKKLVEHIGFQSTQDYKSLAAELSKKLDAQGWAKDGSDLIGVSAILKRKLGGATLTIFVKPAAGGCQVNIMSKGLSWDE